ncbi:unnamed protein product [Paramecium sonneborni]|uniref:protein-disulfide reductase n=1 Tax=Paramecium sonneborni TaxID=65129 RepID=A0A8S1QY88_9CILI|nr:unnamed protein product [Paramecium sonneborni]
MDKFGTSFQSVEGPTDGPNLKNARLIGVYIGAQWSQPCQRFTPSLIEFYTKINEEIQQFEIIYIGMDENEEKYKEIVSDMPWLFYDFKEFVKYQVYNEYKKHIQGIPCLLILNPNNGLVITNQGRGTIEKEGQGAFEKWLTQMSFK